MEIPVYIDGQRAGTAAVCVQDGEAVVTARLGDPGRVVRLTLYGEGEEAYLGVPEPKDGLLRLEKRFSGEAMRRLPKNPAYAAECRQDTRPAKTHVIWHGGRPHYF